MPKNSKNNNKRRRVRAKSNRIVGSKAVAGLLARGDAASRAYAQLIADPCNGPLLPCPYGSGAGGYVFRAENDFLLGASAGVVASALLWSPGNLGCYFANSTVGDTANLTLSAGMGLVPGFTFLSDNARSFRCIAACMQVMWPGSELDRGGICSLAQIPFAENAATDLTVADLRTGAGYIFRTPEESVELVYRPTDLDMDFTTPGATAMSATIGNSALAFSAAGIKAGVGMRIRLVAVYEWIPKVADGRGLATRNTKPAGVTTTLNTLIGAMDRTGDWMFRTAHAAGAAASKFAAGYGAAKSLVAGMGRLALTL